MDIVATDPATRRSTPRPPDPDALDAAVRAELTRRGLAGPGSVVSLEDPSTATETGQRRPGPLHVHIGRVEVITPPPTAPARPTPPPAPARPAPGAVPPSGPAAAQSAPSRLSTFLDHRARSPR